MNNSFPIQGASGGSGKGGGATASGMEADDTLKSEQFATVLDLLCEGEIEGLDDGAKSVFLDDTPVENEDGEYNFKDFLIVTRHGTQAQSYIPVPASTGAIENETAVGIKVDKATPVTRQITNSDVDRVRVTINVPSLQKIDSNGNIIDPKDNTGLPDRRVNPSSSESDLSSYEFTSKEVPLFDGFQIKIIMTGTNQAYVPRIKDLRVIAFA